MSGSDPFDIVEVKLRGLPVQPHHQTSEHIDELLREFSYLDGGEAHVPTELLALRDEMNAQFASFTAQPAQEFQAALTRGADTVDLDMPIPRIAGNLCVKALELLDQADEFCRQGAHLLTLAAPAETVTYRRWFFGEVVRQCNGEPPTPWGS